MKSLAEPISQAQFGWLTGMSVVAGGVYFWPQYLVKHAGIQGVYSLATVVGIAMLLQAGEAVTAANVNAPTYLGSLARIMPLIGAGVVLPLRIGFSLVLDALVLLLYALMMEAYFYPMTPVYVFEVVIILLAGWIAIRTLAAVARSVQFWFPIVLVLFVIVTLLTAPHLRFFAALRPPPRFYVTPWVNTVIGIWYLYSSGTVASTVATHVEWTSRRNVWIISMLAVLGQGIVLFALYATTLAVLGPDALARLYWPLAYVFSLVTIPVFFFKGLGIFIVLIWTSTVVLYMAVRLFVVSWNVAELFPDSGRRTRMIVVGALMVLVLGIATLVPSAVSARHLLNEWVSPAAFAVDIILVPISWLLSLWWVRRQKKVAA